jgi:glyoxylase-like metal-dependent hydrolase (beta-lactamase superfamily II)
LARTAKKTVAKKSAAPRPARRATPAAQLTAAAAVTPASGYRAKVRMYRQGLGDCFLISLPRTDGGNRPFYVMIDCGVVLGTSDPRTIMTQVMDNIVAVTGGEIDLLIATHEHWDHLSGFVQAKESFDKLTVRQVWLAWAENPDDQLTQKLKKEKGQALAALRMGLSQMQLAGDSDGATELNGILEFFGVAKGAATSECAR